MRDCKDEVVEVDGSITPVIFCEILRYIYTSNVEPAVLREDPAHLLAAADLFGIVRLKTICEAHMTMTLHDDNADIAAENVAYMLMASDHHSAENLKAQCLNFFRIRENANKAFETAGFLELQQQKPSLLIEIMKAMNNPQATMQRKRKEPPSDDKGSNVGSSRVVRARRR